MKYTALLLIIAISFSAVVSAIFMPMAEQTSFLFGRGARNMRTEVRDVSDKGAYTAYSRRPHKEEGTIMDKLREDENFSKFVEMLEEHRGLRDDLERSDVHVTLFAPTNEAMEKFKKEMEEMHHGHKKHEREHVMDEIIRYHVATEQLRREDLFNGMTLETDLKLKELNHNRQRVRVFEVKGNIYLNMYARVEKERKAENGYIMPVDAVLIPPPNAWRSLLALPSKFSTFLLAAETCGCKKVLEKGKGITAFIPPNAAWEALGFENLMYLFSERGRKDLEKVIEYHLAKKLVYADELLDENTAELETELKNQKLELTMSKKGSKSRNENDLAFLWATGDDRIIEKTEMKHPADYIISINKGEATVIFTDGVVENGNMLLINNVLIPENVKLPHQKSF